MDSTNRLARISDPTRGIGSSRPYGDTDRTSRRRRGQEGSKSRGAFAGRGLDRMDGRAVQKSLGMRSWGGRGHRARVASPLAVLALLVGVTSGPAQALGSPIRRHHLTAPKTEASLGRAWQVFLAGGPSLWSVAHAPP